MGAAAVLHVHTAESSARVQAGLQFNQASEHGSAPTPALPATDGARTRHSSRSALRARPRGSLSVTTDYNFGRNL